VTFFRDRLSIPVGALDELRSTALWPPIIADAEASLGDLRALSRYDFRAERFRGLHVPVMLQIRTESPRDLYVTDALAVVLPNVRIEELLFRRRGRLRGGHSGGRAVGPSRRRRRRRARRPRHAWPPALVTVSLLGQTPQSCSSMATLRLVTRMLV
jgi:hypothetical protein